MISLPYGTGGPGREQQEVAAMLLLVLLVVSSFLLVRHLLRKLTVRDYSNKYIFITGCDSGFGKHLARKLDNYGFHVFAGCLSEQGARELSVSCSRSLVTVVIDVTDEASIARAVKEVENMVPLETGLWSLVNNAGVAGTACPSEWLTRQDYEASLSVNLFGVISVTKAFLPLVRRAGGRVVNMSSLMARFTTVSAPYTVSKYGIEGYSDCLRHEMYKCGVSVHIIEPGFFQTPLMDKAEMASRIRDRFDQSTPEVKQFYGCEFRDGLIRAMQAGDRGCPDTTPVIDAYTHAVTAVYPKARYVVGLDANSMYRILWNLPEWLSDVIVCRGGFAPRGFKTVHQR